MKIWQKAMNIAQETHHLAGLLPAGSSRSLAEQMRRSAISIPSNIAEGRMRSSDADFKRFLTVAFASGAELETQLELARRFYPKQGIEGRCAKIEKSLGDLMPMMNRFISQLKAKS